MLPAMFIEDIVKGFCLLLFLLTAHSPLLASEATQLISQ